jgi:asparagine synthase (glutamine-hydrolysing)
VQAFVIGHPQAEFDERRWAEEAARICGADFHLETVEPRALDVLPQLVKHYGEPFADSSALPTYYVSRLARRHVKMVLSGDGGDELFAGYFAYPAILWKHRPVASPLRRARHALANQARALGLWPPTEQPEDSKYHRTAALPDALRRKLWRPEFHDLPDATRRQFAERYQAARQSELLNQLQCFDVENYIPYDNLTKVDVASMLHGLEVRVPLLDHEFVELAAQIPPEFKLRRADGRRAPTDWLPPGGPVIGKHLWKRVAGRTFSDEFLHRPKRGFEVPIRDWFGGECGPVLEERVLPASSPLADWFNPAALREVVSQAATDRVASWRAWSLLILAEWLHQSAHREASTVSSVVVADETDRRA